MQIVKIDFSGSSPFTTGPGSKIFIFCPTNKKGISVQQLKSLVKKLDAFIKLKTTSYPNREIPGVTDSKSFLTLIQPFLLEAGLEPVTESVIRINLPYWKTNPCVYLEKQDS